MALTLNPILAFIPKDEPASTPAKDLEKDRPTKPAKEGLDGVIKPKQGGCKPHRLFGGYVDDRCIVWPTGPKF